MMGRNLVRLFELRRGRLDYRIRRDYIRGGVATIPCKIADYGDVISSYSVKGCEALNTEFADYVKDAASVTPDEYPLVLNIIEDCLTDEERATIEETVRDDFAYDLGVVEREQSRHTRIFLTMFFGLILSGIVLWLTQALAEEPRELFFILFWFMGDTLCDYLFLTGHDLRLDRRQAGRLASIKVVFSEHRTADYTAEEVEALCAEIERDVRESIERGSV